MIGIKKDFGTVRRYKEAISIIKDAVKSIVVLKDYDQIPYATEDIKQRAIDIITQDYINDAKKKIVEAKQNYKILSDIQDSSDTKALEYLRKFILRKKDELQIIATMFKDSSVFNKLWKDIYPSYTYTKPKVFNEFDLLEDITLTSEETDEELELCVEAMDACPVEAIGDDGS